MPTWNGNLHRLPLKKNTDLCLATSVLGPKCCLRPAPLAPVSETSAGFAPRLWFWPEPATRTSLEPSQPNSSFFDQSPLTISEQRSSQLLCQLHYCVLFIKRIKGLLDRAHLL